MDTGPKLKRHFNPRFRANLFSILTFGWTLETFKQGYSRNLQDSDLYAPLPEHKSSVLGDVFERAWLREIEKNSSKSKPSLWIVLLKIFGAELMLYGLILAAMELIIRLQQPLFLGLLLRYFSPVQDLHNNTSNCTYLCRLFNYYQLEGEVSWGEAVFFAFGVVFCSAINVMVQHPFMMGVMHIGMKMRVGLCSLIYRKALKVNLQAMSENSAGLVVNLMANDVNRFDTGPQFIHYLWIGPLETMIMTVYLYRDVGIAAVYGALVIIAVIPFQAFLGSRTIYYRRETAVKTDERVRSMNEIIMGIEVIKMYTWEQPFQKIIDIVRRNEIYFIKMTSYIRGIIMSFIMFTSRFAIFITVLVYVLYNNRIMVETIFFLTCYYNILKQTMTLYFPQAIGQVAEMNVAVQRIRDYLLSDECRLPQRRATEPIIIEKLNPKKKVTIIDNPLDVPISSRPKKPSEPSTSYDKAKDLDKKKVAITFMNASSRWILSSEKEDVKELNLQVLVGSLTTVIGSVGSGKSTALHMILGELPCSSGSIEINGTISYASQEPWLFVGNVRQNILFGQPFIKSRYMEVCKVCALERDISLFPHGDKTVVGERGVSLSGGQRARINLARAVYKEADIYLLDDPLSAVDTHVAKHIFERCIKRYLADKTVVLVTHQLQFIKFVDQIVLMDKGTVETEGTYQTLNKTSSKVMRLLQDKPKDVNEEEQISTFTQPSTLSLSKRHMSMVFATSILDQVPVEEYQAIGRVNKSVYRDYFLAGAGCPYASFVCFTFLLAQFCASACDYWISLWSSTEDQLTGDPTVDNIIWADQGLQRNQFMIIFGVITLATIFVALLRALLFFSLCMKSSIKLHDNMFESISRSPMSFFHANTSGRILNRFSKDMGAVDELLPQAMIDCFQIILNLFGTFLVILMTDLALLIPIAAVLIIFYILRLIYIRTSGAVKRLEGITRSPVFGHLNATIMGMATIRAFGAEQLLSHEFDRHQDLHSAAWYLFITCSRAFGYFLDIICLLFIVCVTFSCIMKTEIESSKLGLAITQSIALTGIFQWGMRQSAEVENQMTSVERVLEYTKLTQETDLRCPPEKRPPKDWPSEGAIYFDEVSLKYSSKGDFVLHKLVINIEPHEKIGIVGRTGAGKSSIIQALFRLAYMEGTIIIDGIDISSIGLHDLRDKISIIPQEPVLFSGTLRKNLDPFNEYNDSVLLDALSKVELNTGEGTEVLYKQVSDGGSNFSVGERQLVCLARAAVRNNSVLLMDEATANVDAHTDALVQAAIKEHFRACTVLTVAHRLNTVIHSDKILVLDAGRLMEFDHPHLLLQNHKGYFRKMVAETGSEMAKLLHKAAAENYESATE